MSETTDVPPIQGDDGKEAEGEPGKRERSSIDFPYMALPEAIQVAEGVHKHSGGGVCQHDQLAGQLNLSMNSSGYRVRLATARSFGLIESDRSAGGVKLTPVGHAIVDPKQAREAKANAFLSVELYAKLYEYYRGKVLPPPPALEREMAEMGVSPKQTDRARQAFERSAEAAGFFEAGRDRLVKPGKADGVPIKDDKKDIKDHGEDRGSGDGLKLDPLIIELLRKIPPTQDGWPAPKRLRWMRTFAMNVSQIYDNEDTPVELKIEIQEGG